MDRTEQDRAEWAVRVEMVFTVVADSEEAARFQAIDDLAFGRASVAEAIVTDIRAEAGR